MSYDDIIKDIDAHLQKSSKQYYSDFYVGITDNIQERVFGYHKVPQTGYWFITRGADTEQIARDVEKHYLDLGMDGGTGGGTGGDTKIVYCYEIGPNTKERD